MSWISNKDFVEWGLGRTNEERTLFNRFWDRPEYTKWSDDNDEDYILYLDRFQEAYEENRQKPRSGFEDSRLTYSELLRRLDPLPKKAPKEKTWGERMREFQKSGKDANMEVAEFEFNGKSVYVSEPMKEFDGGDRAVFNAEGTEVLGRLGDPKFKTLFEKVKQAEEGEEEEEEANTPDKRMVRAVRECPKTPRQPNSSVRKTKMPMREANPNRRGWRLPRKPYGHAREVVELEDDLTDAELKKMTSELPRRCLVDAVQDWARENDKIVLPSITRADKAEIVATIKEHRIPVPKLTGGYYGEDDDVSCLFGDGDQKCVEINLAGGADPPPRDDPMGEDTDTDTEEEEEEESEDDFSRDVAFRCAECGQDIMWGSPEYAGRRDTPQGQICADCAERLGIESEEEQEEDYETDSGPEGADTPRRAHSPEPDEMEGGAIPIDKALYEKAKAEVYPKYKKPSAYRSGALIKRYKELGGRFKEQGERKLARWFKEDWKDVAGMDYPVYRPTKRITKDTPLTPSEIDPTNMKQQAVLKQKYKGKKNLPKFEGRGEDAYLAQAKEFAKKAGYKDWDKIKYANDGVHKLELNGVKFGRKGYGDFIEYGMKDGEKEAKKHRKSYLARATNMPGNWKEDKYSKNNLAIKVLWGGSPFFHLRGGMVGGAAQPALPPNIDLQSKKENPQVEEIIEEPMDDGDIRAYYPNAKIMKYSDLKDYKTITQLLPKDKSYAFLLYQHAPNNGHWVLLMRYGKTIEFFCSYGSQIDAPLKWTNPRDRQMLGEAVPYLTNLLKAQKEFNVIHNPVQYQSKGSDKATCGAHDVMRLSQMLNHGQDLTDYYDYMNQIKKESGLSYDEIVANFVSKR